MSLSRSTNVARSAKAIFAKGSVADIAIQYCSLILHREGVLQLLLWREGKRHILQPDSAEVEDGLHRLAVELSKQGDILTLVMALRQQRLGLANLKRESTLVGPKALARTGSGTRSRPRQGSFRSS